jgi:hypothetical protein
MKLEGNRAESANAIGESYVAEFARIQTRDRCRFHLNSCEFSYQQSGKAPGANRPVGKAESGKRIAFNPQPSTEVFPLTKQK